MNKNNIQVTTTKHTSLETSKDIADTLAWKIEAIKSDDLPIDTALADYISFTDDNLNKQLVYLKDVKAQIASKEKEIKKQIETIKVDGATFLLDNGIERLDGAIYSSVTVSKAKESKTTTEEVKEFQMNITQAELEELLIGLGKGEIITKTIEKTSNAIPPKLKINKRKVIVPEVV